VSDLQVRKRNTASGSLPYPPYAVALVAKTEASDLLGRWKDSIPQEALPQGAPEALQEPPSTGNSLAQTRHLKIETAEKLSTPVSEAYPTNSASARTAVA
jgi:hypothetical protein